MGKDMGLLFKLAGLLSQLLKNAQLEGNQTKKRRYNKRTYNIGYTHSPYKKCRECGRKFIPKKSYYNTCPNCFQ